jgi:tryptophan synthase beta chain
LQTKLKTARAEARVDAREYTASAKKAKEEGVKKTILFNLSGHGLIDMAAYDQYICGDLTNYELPDDVIKSNVDKLEKLV